MGTVTFLQYIESRYGREHGNRKLFLKDNPHMSASEVSRWIIKGYLLDLDNGSILKPANKKVNLKKSVNDEG